MPKIGDVARRCDIGLKGRHKVYWVSCPDCGKERWAQKPDTLCRSCHGRYAQKHQLKFWNESEHRKDCQCMRCRMKSDQWGENNHMWNGGVCYSSGYRTVKIYPDNPYYEMADSRGYVMEHRLVIAEKFGRVLDRNETVHHVNGIKDDNRLENLEVWWGNHGKGVRVKDMLASWARLYDFHCECCEKGEKHEQHN